MSDPTEPLSVLVGQLAHQLGGAAMSSHLAGLSTLVDSLGGLQSVLSDTALQMRPSDGRALMHALAGFEAIFLDLTDWYGLGSELDEVRDAIQQARESARRLAERLDLEAAPIAVYGAKR